MSIAKKFEVIADEIYRAGVKNTTNELFNRFTNNGKRTRYNAAFAQQDWSGMDFTGYGLTPVYCTQMFIDYKGEELPKGIDLSQTKNETASSGYYDKIFKNAKSLKSIYDMQLPALYVYNEVYYGCKSLQTVEILRCQEETLYINSFYGCESLMNINVTGKIGQSGFNVKDCTKLTKKSILSILKALSLDITETKTITFSKSAHQSIIETDIDCKPYWEAAKKDPNSDEPGWTFVYA